MIFLLAGVLLLTARPSLITLVTLSRLLVGLTWLPFGLALEALFRRWHDRERLQVAAAAA